jgi:hypothetical protein
MKTLRVPDSYTARFCARLIYERDRLDTARGRDQRSPRKQRGPWERSRVGRLLGRLRPRAGFGIAEQLYQKALAEAAQGAMPTVFAPMLAAAWEAHRKLLAEMRRVDWSADTLARHGDALQSLIDHLPAVTPAKTRKRKGKADASKVSANRGGRPRKWDALWAVIREQDAKTPKPKDTRIAGEYNRKYGSQVGQNEKMRATAEIVRQVRCARRKQNPK